jgi:hypothetical protein
MINEQLEDYHYKLSLEVRANLQENEYRKVRRLGWQCKCHSWNGDDRAKCWQCNVDKPKEVK